MANFVEELKRRSVFRVAIGYLVVAWLVLQLTDLVFENMNAPDWVMQAIMLALLAGLPVALVLAWAFELKADGLQRESEISSESPANNRLFYAVVGVISIAAIGLFLWQQTNAPAPVNDTANDTVSENPNNESLLAIAVLPFESFTEDREDEYFADGLADTLLHKLSQLETLTVIARNSSFQYKGQNVDVREVGKALGVPTVVEGSVQRQGEQIRVIAQLVSTEDGAHWWSGTFDGTFENVFELQDEIAAAITEQLQITLSDRDRERLYRNGTNIPEAYDALARARAIDVDLDSVDFDPDNNAQIKLLREAVELDPNYAQAWVGLADYYNEVVFLLNDNNRFDELVAKNVEAARKAIEVDPTEPRGFVSLGFGHWRLQEVAEAEDAFRKALAINPNEDGALAGLGLVLLRRNPEEAYLLFKRTQEIDPRNRIVYRQLYFALSNLGRMEDGIEQLRTGIQEAPDFFILYDDLARTHAQSFGQHDKAAKVVSDLLRRDADSRAGMNTLTDAWLAVDDVQRARAWNDKVLEADPNDTNARSNRINLLQKAGDIKAASAIANSLPSQGFARLSRSMHLLQLCMISDDRSCAIENLKDVEQFMIDFETRSDRTMPGYQAVLNYYRGRLRYPDDATVNLALEKAASAFRNFSLLSSGSFDVDSRRYYLAEILTMQGDKAAAVAELHRTLELADGGFISLAPGRRSPENSEILVELRDEPGYDDWLKELTSRRSAMRERMVEMEAAGEIVPAP